MLAAIITHIDKDGKSVILPKLIAESLNNHFSSLQTKAPASKKSQRNHLNPCKTQFHFKRIEEDEVCACLTKLNTRKATGVDGITAGMLQKCAGDISPGITTLFNHSLTTGKIPAEWKRANVTPIQKTPNDHKPNNYRPISVLPVIVKVMEQIIHKQLYTHMASNNQISHQSGFRPAHSTQDVILKTVEDWKTAIDQGKHVGAVLIDLSKAFDSIDHKILLRKLESYGLQENELKWFENYLQDREQRVLVNSSASKWAAITRGVPQGSILGPLLFVIFVNDLPNVVKSCKIHLYADDTTIYSSHKLKSEVEKFLNTDLQNISQWIEDNNLKMNIKKTQFISLTNSKKTGKINIQLKGESIKETDSIKYLGVTVDRDLKWNSHISGVKKKASAGIACLRKISPSIPINTRKLLFNALVRPHLDYCSVVWHACSNKLKDRVESIQNYGMRVILGKPPRTPSSPLRSELGWTTLEQRREELMLVQVHRSIIKTAPIDSTCKNYSQRTPNTVADKHK